MELSDAEKLRRANEAVQGFVDQFGPNDIVKLALIDVLLEEIYGDSVPVPSPAEQESNQDRSNHARRVFTYKIE